MKAVILAAGRGTRLSPVTDDRSKAMAPVLGRPLVDRVVETLAVNGLRDLVMVIGSDDDEIRRFFTFQTSLDVTVSFVVQEERLGMAHALGLAAALIEGPFVLSACDSLKPVEHVRDLLRAGREADGALSLMDVPWDRVCLAAPVEMEGRVIRRIVEKPALEDAPSNTVSLPLYLLPQRALDLLAVQGQSARGEYELQDVIQALIDEGSEIVGVKTTSRLQVSTPEDLLDLNLRFLDLTRTSHQCSTAAVEALHPAALSHLGVLNGLSSTPPRPSDRKLHWTQHLDVLVTKTGEKCGLSPGGRVPETVPDGTIIQDPVWIDDGVTLGRNCFIGPDVVLERGCVLGHGVHVTRSMVLRNALVPDGLSIEGQVVTGE